MVVLYDVFIFFSARQMQFFIFIKSLPVLKDGNNISPSCNFKNTCEASNKNYIAQNKRNRCI